jgi:hypothetical protein
MLAVRPTLAVLRSDENSFSSWQQQSPNSPVPPRIFPTTFRTVIIHQLDHV